MKKLFCLIAPSIGLLAISSFTFACTTWGVIGNASVNNGLLIAKNRDSAPPSPERLQMFHPKHGYAYFALVYKDHPKQHSYPYVSAGVNNQGLVVVNNSAITMPTKHRDANESVIMRSILMHCRNVSQVLADQKNLFTTNKVNDLLIGDKHTLALVEIGKYHQYAIWVKHDGILFHTNSYVAKKLLSQNISKNKMYNLSSKIRYQRIKYLLHSKPMPLTLKDFHQFSNDRHDGPIYSIFKVGATPHSPHTLATWIVSIPRNGIPYLYVRLTEPNQPVVVQRFHLTAKFWK